MSTFRKLTKVQLQSNEGATKNMERNNLDPEQVRLHIVRIRGRQASGLKAKLMMKTAAESAAAVPL